MLFQVLFFAYLEDKGAVNVTVLNLMHVLLKHIALMLVETFVS